MGLVKSVKNRCKIVRLKNLVGFQNFPNRKNSPKNTIFKCAWKKGQKIEKFCFHQKILAYSIYRVSQKLSVHCFLGIFFFWNAQFLPFLNENRMALKNGEN